MQPFTLFGQSSLWRPTRASLISRHLGDRDGVMRVPSLQCQFRLPPKRNYGLALTAPRGAAVLSEVVVHAILSARRDHRRSVVEVVQEAETLCEDPGASADAVSLPLSAAFFSSSL